MDAVVDLASWISLVLGSAFCVVGGIGMIRMPDFYTRTHAASLTDTLGATLILFGLGLQAGLSLITVKLIFVLVFIYLTSPTSAHALVKAAYSRGVAAPELHDDGGGAGAGAGAGADRPNDVLSGRATR
jgi:multicomponent Na+:H+ antiporter subunit G